MKRNRRSYKKVGSFTLTQPKMLVSDPGYEKDEWCSKTVKDCMTGIWDAYINVNRYEFKYDDNKVGKTNRVAELFVCHSSVGKEVFASIHLEYRNTLQEREDDNCFFRWFGPWAELSENIGVDSGQAGFFDYDKFGDNSLFKAPGECGFGDKWYSNCCDLTLEDHGGIVADCGVNVASGFGDGCYCVWEHKSAAGETDAMVLFFLPDNDPIEES